MKLRALCILAAVMLGGCMSTGPLFAPADTAPQGRGLLYIYRMPTIVGSAAVAEFYIDDKHIMSLYSGGYSYCYLKAGPHELTQYWNLSALDRAAGIPVPHPLLDFNIADGGTAYIRFQLGGGVVNNMPARIMMLKKVDSVEPPPDLREQHFQEPDAKLCD